MSNNKKRNISSKRNNQNKSKNIRIKNVEKSKDFQREKNESINVNQNNVVKSNKECNADFLTNEREKKNINKNKENKKIVLIVLLSLISVLMLINANIFIFCSSKIYLKGKSEIVLPLNNEYKEEGYSAKFIFFNVTKKVKIKSNFNSKKTGFYFIQYKIKYPLRTTITYRKIKVVDQTSPVISLNGDQEITMYTNQAYNDAGCKALDNYDGDISFKVNKTGHVDVNKAGTYKIKYAVSDTSGNFSSIERTVTVIDRKPLNGKVIYLTFDDGPSSSITPKLLDILKEEDVKATFFVINHSSSLDYLIKREYDEGHTVGLHSYTHDYSTIYSSEAAYFNDLNAIRNKIKQITGNDANIIRFPGGSSNTVSRKYSNGIMTRLTRQVLAKGYIYFDWNIGSGDSGDVHTSDAVYNKVVNSLNYGTNVVLMHDFENNTKTLDAIRNIIEYGKNNGYSFAAITKDTPIVVQRINN